MKSSISKKEYEDIYRFLDEVTPVGYDCGTLCGAACCTMSGNGDEEMGIYLLPGEEELFKDEEGWIELEMLKASEFGFPDSWDGEVAFAYCMTPPHCKRRLRPIQCRTFPLTPHLTADDELLLLYNDTELPYSCPLIEKALPLNDDFFESTYAVWERLIKDPLIYDLVKLESSVREEAVASLAEKLLDE